MSVGIRIAMIAAVAFAAATPTATLAASIAPSTDEIKAVIAARSAASLSSFTFGSILVAAARAPSNGEMRASGLPPGKSVNVVRATYTQVTGGDLGRDHVQNYYFFHDDFGGWSAQPASMPTNYTSDLKKVR